MNTAQRLVSFVAVAMILVTYAYAHASMLSYVSDLISTSAPASSAKHTIQFTLAQAIPASGRIAISLPDGAFDIPGSFDYTNVHLSVSSGAGPYVDRSLSAAPDASNDGVSVVTGADGRIYIDLNSTTGMNAGDAVRVTLDSIVNPTNPDSYRLEIDTLDDSGNALDYGQPIIAIVAPVSINGSVEITFPIRFNALPQGPLPAGSATIELSLQTAQRANCRFATSSGVLYTNMTGIFPQQNATLFFVNVTNQQDGTTYDYYVRCATPSGNANPDDLLIEYTLAPTPVSNSSVDTTGTLSTNGLTGNLGNGGAGSVPHGSNELFLATVEFSGWSIPNAAVTILRDGVIGGTVNAKSDGTFDTTLTGMERGAYTFQTYTTDSSGQKSASYASTLTLGQGTVNQITSIVVPPTITLSNDTVGPGDPLTVSGETIPNARVEVSIKSQGVGDESSAKIFAATSSASGVWTEDIDTKSLAKGIYDVSAKAIESAQAKSDPSKAFPLTVGATATAAKGSCSTTPDLNGDSKVNLVDFSIFLTFWNTSEPKADFNCDNAVNLADFSIMLFNWTG